jgi:hypothetical protein
MLIFVGDLAGSPALYRSSVGSMSPDPPIRLEAPSFMRGRKNELAALAAFILTADRIEGWNKL